MIPAPKGHAWPPGTGWAWRLDLSVPGDTLWPGRAVASGAEVTPELKVFHEGAGAGGVIAPAPAGFALWGMAAAGGFVSVVADLPEAGLARLTARHIVAVTGRARLSGPRPLTARINLRHGPNTARQTRPVRIEDGLLSAEFDLAYTDLSHAPVTAAWVDLILGEPQGAALVLTDLALSHRPRAEP